MDTQRILHEVEAEIAKLQGVAEVLRGLTSNGISPQAKRKQLSAAGRRAISVAQKARWAKRTSGPQAAAAKPKRTLSAAARQKIGAAQRARWAKVKKAA